MPPATTNGDHLPTPAGTSLRQAATTSRLNPEVDTSAAADHQSYAEQRNHLAHHEQHVGHRVVSRRVHRETKQPWHGHHHRDRQEESVVEPDQEHRNDEQEPVEDEDQVTPPCGGERRTEGSEEDRAAQQHSGPDVAVSDEERHAYAGEEEEEQTSPVRRDRLDHPEPQRAAPPPASARSERACTRTIPTTASRRARSRPGTRPSAGAVAVLGAIRQG